MCESGRQGVRQREAASRRILAESTEFNLVHRLTVLTYMRPAQRTGTVTSCQFLRELLGTRGTALSLIEYVSELTACY